ncbi:thioredoxin family protein [Subsaxibacter sp. CAU 1640]|uniref:thioredoxin family protein n=1 Tax=Subsaxibacter sp. CAU 1640 TaxID=2933271 RepID=UPI002003E62A|nr:thioredoxin family protein [Subsaxibacter sp. CAU 1640]MCK7591612.1 thioredoxin family protein [Subsaxibacter sp. CAU 1640]
MAQTPSNMLPLGTKAPDFKLLDTVTEQNVSLDEAKGLKGTVIMFICNHCPFVKHINAQLVRLAKDYKPKGINFIAISSNDVENYPQDAPDKMKETAKAEGYIFPYLYDASQQVAKAYKAACTPDFYMFDEKLKLIYRGQLDDSRPSNGVPVDGKDIRNALNALLNNQPVSPEQKPSIGCNIKWKPENR